MVRDPYAFWEQQRLFSPKGLSYNSLLGQFMVFTTDAELSRRALSINDEKTLLMAVHPSGKAILGEHNLAFMHGPPHKAIRYVGVLHCGITPPLLLYVLVCCRFACTPCIPCSVYYDITHTIWLHHLHQHRKSFLSLFTRKALSTYVELQDGIVRNHIAQWLEKPGEREVRNDVRYVLNMW